MSDATRDDGSSELLALIEGHCYGTLSNAEFAMLEQRLLADAEARALFRRYLGLDAALRDFGDSAAADWSLNRQTAAAVNRRNASESESPRVLTNPGSKNSRLSLIGLTILGAVCVVLLFVIIFHRGRADASVIGTLEQVMGDVLILPAVGEPRALDADATIKSGDTVRTLGTQSSTVMAYPDGTRLTLVGDTSVTCGDQRSGLFVHHGMLEASIRPQPREKPMLLATPSARMRVLGTRFLIEAAANRTDLSVSEGRVRLVRIRDGEAVEVADGKQATVADQNKLLVQDIPALSTTWERDFENGLPEGWVSGEWTTEGLPAGSRGGVKSASWELEGDQFYGIRSQIAWMPGLFAVQKNSHLHVTFKVESSKWINVFLVTRTADAQEPRYSGNYLLRDFPKEGSGQWQTVSIPLADFQRIHRGEIPVEDVVPFSLMFVSDSPDRGLVIDRIWITPDGPGEIELKVSE